MWEKEIKRIILGLVWKFRNIGYKDPMYAPAVQASIEKLSDAKMEMIERKAKTKLRPQDFEDLVGEANVILAELLAKKERGIIDNVRDELYVALTNSFISLHRSLNKYGLTVGIEEAKNVPDEETPFTFAVRETWRERLATENLTPDVKMIAKAIIYQDKRLRKHIDNGRFSKNALKKFCMQDLGWPERRFRKAIAHCNHVRF